MSKKNPLISVVIPTFNRTNLLTRALTSVINQTLQDFEIIVVDDGSTDETEDAVRDFQDSRIRYIKHEVNRNGAVARNTGVSVSGGEYIAFLDSDDEWLPAKLEKQLEWVMSSPHQGNIVCYSQLIKDDGMVKVQLPSRGKLTHEPLSDYLFIHYGLMQTSTLLIPRSLLMRVQFSPELIRHHDWDLCLRLEREGIIFLFLPKPLTIWHMEPREDHLSNHKNYQFSITWIKRYKTSISVAAYSTFMLDLIKKYKESMSAETVSEIMFELNA